MKYFVIRSIEKPFSDCESAINKLGTSVEMVNYIWNQPSFVKEHILLLRINKTTVRKNANLVCRYMKCTKCDYSERYIFDFEKKLLVVEATKLQVCTCRLSMKVKHRTYEEIKKSISECTEMSTITPTSIQKQMMSAQKKGEDHFIPSKIQIKNIKYNMKRKVSDRFPYN